MNILTSTKRICIILNLLLLSSYSSGQEIYFSSGLLNDKIHTTDSIKYQYGISATYSGCKIINRTIVSKNDSIFLNTCTVRGNLAAPCGVLDTILIAQNLSIGDYTLVHYSNMAGHLDDTLCVVWADDPTEHDTAYYPFTVLPPTATQGPTSLGGAGLLPNPVGSSLHLTFALPPSSPISARIFDVSGRMQMRLILPAMDKPEQDVSVLPPGIYFLKLMDGQGRSGTFRFVKL